MATHAPKLNGANGSGISPETDYVELLEKLTPLIAPTNLKALTGAATRIIAELFNAEACSLLLYDARHRTLSLSAATHIPESEWGDIRLDPSRGLVGSVFKSGKVELLQSEADFRNFGITPDARYGHPSCIVLPLKVDGKTRGIFNIAARKDGKGFGPEEVRLLEAAAKLVATGIRNAEEYQESVIDHERLQEILENLHVGVVALDEGIRITHVNQRFKELLLAPGTRVKGRKLKKVVEPELYAVCKRMIRDAIRTKSVCQDRAVLLLKDGERILEITASPPQCGESSHRDALLMVDDVARDEEVKRLREADSIKGGFLRTISHELRTPLTVIRGALPLLKGCSESVNDSSTRMLGKVEDLLRTNVNRLSGVVNTILDVVEIDNGSLRLLCCPIDLNKVIGEEIERLTDRAERKNIHWEFGLSEDLPPLQGDRQRVGQALHELFDNAIKHSPQGGRINVRTRRRDGEAEIWIGNFGEPIAKRLRDEIFEKFFQLDQSTTRESGGVGLGLYLARNVALLHRGSLEVIDGEAGETVFLLRLPLEQPARQSAPL